MSGFPLAAFPSFKMAADRLGRARLEMRVSGRPRDPQTVPLGSGIG